MIGRLGIFSVLGALLFAAVGAYASLAALDSCAIRLDALSHVSGCPSGEDRARSERLASLATERDGLLKQILAIETKIGGTQCVAVGPDQTGPMLPATFANKNLGGLYGCWDLGSVYQTRDVDTEKIISYPTWRMCFDYKGNGKQVMRGNDGSTCEGPVTAGFDDQHQLLIDEGDNLTCSDGGYIHQREIACAMANGGIVCSTLQPETEGEKDVPLSRWR